MVGEICVHEFVEHDIKLDRPTPIRCLKELDRTGHEEQEAHESVVKRHEKSCIKSVGLLTHFDAVGFDILSVGTRARIASDRQLKLR